MKHAWTIKYSDYNPSLGEFNQQCNKWISRITQPIYMVFVFSVDIWAHFFSCAVGREEHCKQISLACVGSARTVWATLGLPPLMACVLSHSTLLRLQVALQGKCLKWALGCMLFPGLSHSGSFSWVHHKGNNSVGSAFCALPRSEELRWPRAWQAQFPGCAVGLITSPVPVPQFSGCSAGALSQMCHVSPVGTWSLTVTLLVDVNHPGSQEDLVSNWEPAHSLVEDVISRVEMTITFWLWLWPACRSTSSRRRGRPQPASSPLIFAQSFVLWAGQAVPQSFL